MVASAAMRLSFPEPSIALLTLDLPGKGANVLSQRVLEELAGHLDTLESRQDLAGLVIGSGKPGQFIAGADLREFLASMGTPNMESFTFEMCRRGQRLFARLSQVPFVTVAAIDGICVGGGAELASWCDRRVMASGPRTQFGFPEVKLGLYPGWGGTARAPRIVGLSGSIEMIAGGESIGAAEALKMGWASDVVASDNLLPAAFRLIQLERASGQYLRDRVATSGPIKMSETELSFLGITASAFVQQQSKGAYPAPVAALEQILAGSRVSSEEACVQEAKGMARLFGTPINQALLNIFFLTDRNKKDLGIDLSAPVSNATVPDIRTLSVLGAGIMGAGIAAAHLKRELPTWMSDTNPEALERGCRNVLDEVAFQKETKRKDVDQAIRLAAKFQGTTHLELLAKSDLVIEAVVENEQVKRQVYSTIEPYLGEQTILASNTSTIPISRLAIGLKNPQQFCGIHFFNPVRKMKLVEVIRGEHTSDTCVAAAVKYTKAIGKMPVVVKDGPGFLVNRLLLPYMDEAAKLLEEGVSIEALDKAAKAFGMPMGPIELYDMVGLDTAVFAGKVLCDAFPDRFSGSPIVPALVAAGRLGCKNGIGFYSYRNKKQRREPDPGIAGLLTPFVKQTPSNKAGGGMKKEALTERLFLPMVTEASRVLQERLVRDPRDVDLGLIFGIGFPPFRGGLLFWADTLGAAKLVEMLKPYAHLGPRYQPNELFLDLARTGKKFYECYGSAAG